LIVGQVHALKVVERVGARDVEEVSRHATANAMQGASFLKSKRLTLVKIVRRKFA
jgi:hypothetical protein